MKRISFYTSILFLILYSCSSNKPKNIKNKDVPDWYLNPPKIEGKYVGVGDAKRPQISLSKTVATTRAMAEISRIVETQMTTMLKSYLQASGLGENASCIGVYRRCNQICFFKYITRMPSGKNRNYRWQSICYGCL